MKAIIIQSCRFSTIYLLLIFCLTLSALPKALAQPDCAWIDGMGSYSANKPVSCMGENVTQDFNTNNGGFTSGKLTWDPAAGYWIANLGRLSGTHIFSITSGVYTLNQEGWVNYGFIFRAGTRIDIQILDADNDKVIAQCVAAGYTNYSELRNYKITCMRLPSPGTNAALTKGKRVKFRTLFYMSYSKGFSDGKTIIYDNFSVAGSATEEGSTSTLTSTSSTLLQERSLPTKVEAISVTLFPNPVTHQATLSFEELSEGAVLYLSKVDGQLLQTHRLKKGAVSALLDLSKERPGIYIATLQDGKGNKVVRKLIKLN